MKQALLGRVLVLALVTFAAIGVAYIFEPDWFMKRSGIRRGVERPGEYNRAGFQIAAAAFAASATYMLYSLFRHWLDEGA